MDGPGNPIDPGGTPDPGPDPQQPGWASPTPQPAPTPPPPPSFATPTAAPGDAGWSQPPPPPKKRKLTWLWILIPVLLVFAVSAVLVVVFAVRAVVGPIEATNDYFTLLRQERYAEAYSERCKEFRNQLTQADFVRREQASGRVGDFDIDSFDTDGDTATTEGTASRAGLDFKVTVSLRKEDGDWKVCGIEAARK